MGTTITIRGKDYDVNRDFTWEEILLVEELANVPLARRDAFDSMGVIGALMFVVRKRTEEGLTWEQFVKEPMDLGTEDEDEDTEDEAKAAKPRPTRAKAA